MYLDIDWQKVTRTQGCSFSNLSCSICLGQNRWQRGAYSWHLLYYRSQEGQEMTQRAKPNSFFRLHFVGVLLE